MGASSMSFGFPAYRQRCVYHSVSFMCYALCIWWSHYRDVIMSTMASQITSLTIVYLTVYSGADQRKHQSSASLAFVWGIHRGPVNSPHKWPVTRKMFSFDDVIMFNRTLLENRLIATTIMCFTLLGLRFGGLSISQHWSSSWFTWVFAGL